MLINYHIKAKSDIGPNTAGLWPTFHYDADLFGSTLSTAFSWTELVWSDTRFKQELTLDDGFKLQFYRKKKHFIDEKRHAALPVLDLPLQPGHHLLVLPRVLHHPSHLRTAIKKAFSVICSKYHLITLFDSTIYCIHVIPCVLHKPLQIQDTMTTEHSFKNDDVAVIPLAPFYNLVEHTSLSPHSLDP